MDTQQWDPQVPLILVTNDDGIASPGLVAAVEAARTLGQVVVAAPTTQQTARGRSIVGEKGDYFHSVELKLTPHPHPHPALLPLQAWHVNASPALVVRHALATIFRVRYPDLVISGINYGENLGNNIMISGTLGAAFQAAAQGVPALAMSRQTDITHHFSYEELDWTDAERVTRKWAQRLLEVSFRGAYHPPDGRVPTDGSTDHPAGLLPFDVLKIDIPDECPPGTEERFTRLSGRHYFMSLMENAGPETPIGAAVTTVDIDPAGLARDDDIYAVAVDGVVSITPLQLDNTAPLAAAASFLNVER
jgi:5'-nucleotidase